MDQPLDSVLRELDALRAASLSRRLPLMSGPRQVHTTVDGRAALDFCSNNYLGLANDPVLLAAAARSLDEEGLGAGASRLIAGNLASHRLLEHRICSWQRAEAALLFNSGYQANLGILTALAGPDDIIFSDQLNHASLIDGARLSRATVSVFPHRDTDTLARQLASASAFRRRIVVSESLFSMDGDTAPLSSLVDLARNYRALLVVDEAHALGVLGGSGAGLAAGLPVDVRMATLGKALGGFGAFVVAANPIIELLVNRARTFVFTTALPPAIAAAAIAAIDLVSSDEGDARRERLAHVCASFHDRLADLGLAGGASDDRLAGHIVPLHVGDAGRVMELSRSLLARGIFIQGIRPPTVPDGSARLRVTLTAAHADDDLDLAIAALAELREHFGRG